MDWASGELVSSQETPSFEDGGWEEVDSDMDSSCKSNEIIKKVGGVCEVPCDPGCSLRRWFVSLM